MKAQVPDTRALPVRNSWDRARYGQNRNRTELRFTAAEGFEVVRRRPRILGTLGSPLTAQVHCGRSFRSAASRAFCGSCGRRGLLGCRLVRALLCLLQQRAKNARRCAEATRSLEALEHLPAREFWPVRALFHRRIVPRGIPAPALQCLFSMWLENCSGRYREGQAISAADASRAQRRPQPGPRQSACCLSPPCSTAWKFQPRRYSVAGHHAR